MTDLGAIGANAADAAVDAARTAAVVAMYAAVESAVRDGRVAIECTVDPDGQAMLRTIATTVPTETCPGCGRAPISRGSMAPLGADGVLVSVCTSCSAVARSVDAAFRQDPFRELDR